MKKILIPALVLATAQLGACASTPDHREIARCSGACTTHEEGYQWAQGANLLDAAACRDYSPAFIDGCKDGVEDLFQLRRSTRSNF